MKKILIAGYYGYYNSGDDAILKSLCKDIMDIDKENQITVLSKKPEVTVKEYGVKAVNRFSLNAIKKECESNDILLMGGGSLLQDRTSTRSLLYYLFIIWMALKKKKKVMLYANGIGPINKYINKRITKRLLNKVDIITLREGKSREELSRLKINKPKIYITADPVFTLDINKVKVENILKKENIDTSKPLVGVMFRNWAGSEDYVIKIAKICDYIIEHFDMNILFIPMKHPVDLDISNTIMNLMEKKSYILRGKYDNDTIIEIIGNTKLILSMRLHALIYSAIKNVPMVGFEYDQKVTFYLNELNMYSAGKINSFKVDSVLEHIAEIFDNYADIQIKLAKKLKELSEKAKKNKELLAKLIKD